MAAEYGHSPAEMFAGVAATGPKPEPAVMPQLAQPLPEDHHHNNNFVGAVSHWEMPPMMMPFFGDYGAAPPPPLAYPPAPQQVAEQPHPQLFGGLYDSLAALAGLPPDAMHGNFYAPYPPPQPPTQYPPYPYASPYASEPDAYVSNATVYADAAAWTATSMTHASMMAAAALEAATAPAQHAHAGQKRAKSAEGAEI